jgi:hypothetical protein
MRFDPKALRDRIDTTMLAIQRSRERLMQTDELLRRVHRECEFANTKRPQGASPATSQSVRNLRGLPR